MTGQKTHVFTFLCGGSSPTRLWVIVLDAASHLREWLPEYSSRS